VKIVISSCELFGQDDAIHVQWFSRILVSLLVFFYLIDLLGNIIFRLKWFGAALQSVFKCM